MLKIYTKQNTGLQFLNDSKALMNTQMIWMIFMKIFKNKIQIKNKKY